MTGSPGARSLDLGGGVRVDVLLDALAQHPRQLADAFPGDPREGWTAVVREHPETAWPSGHWRLPVFCWLVRTPAATVLVDAGVGPRGSVAAGWLGAPGALPRRLEDAGVALGDIDTVVLTHTHQDHVGWISDPLTPAPLLRTARVVVTRAELAFARRQGWPAAVGQALDPVIERGLLETVEPGSVAAGVDLLALPGHTPGHTGVRVTGTERTLLITADAYNHPLQIAEPDIPSGADADRAAAAATRRGLAAAAGDGLLAASHMPGSLYTIRAGRWAPAGAGTGRADEA